MDKPFIEPSALDDIHSITTDFTNPYERTVQCPACQGRGNVPSWLGLSLCGMCNGWRWVRESATRRIL